MPRLITLFVALLFGGLFSQAPEFQQQYRQRLGGALDEVVREVQRFADDASAAGITTEAALQRLRTNADQIARSRGNAMLDTIARRDRLERQQHAFEKASVIGRLASLAVDLDPVLAAGTWATFRPAVPATLDGLAAALFGAGIGLFGLVLVSLGMRIGRSHGGRKTVRGSAGGQA